MKNRYGFGLLFAASLALAGFAIGYPAFGAAPAAPGAAAPAGGGLQILEFKPAMDDLMTMLVQPRHMKLYYAAQQQNWMLAGFELNELGAALRRIGYACHHSRPQFGIFVFRPVAAHHCHRRQDLQMLTTRECFKKSHAPRITDGGPAGPS